MPLLKIFIILLIAHCSLFIVPWCVPLWSLLTEVLRHKTSCCNKSRSARENSKNFKATTIRLYFNKFVKLNNINSNAVISPPTDKQPEYILKGKSLEIKLSGKLKDSTTYTIMLDNCIEDTRENNIATDLQYVFSTGTYLDSMMIKGKLVDAFTLKPEKDILVMLYKDLGDSLPYKKKPQYVCRTDADGNFELRNLKNTKYKIFALKDLNSNLLYYSAREKK